MGGRGASSGISNKGKIYGSEYYTILKSGNIKFVKYNDSKSATTPMETMTKGRVYVTVNNQNKLKSVTYYDKNNRRYKQIDIEHYHKIDGKKQKPHIHKGYEHNEKGTKTLSEKENKMLERVTKTWYNYNNRNG